MGCKYNQKGMCNNLNTPNYYCKEVGCMYSISDIDWQHRYNQLVKFIEQKGLKFELECFLMRDEK